MNNNNDVKIPNLMIGTPCYGSSVHSDYLHCLLNLKSMIDFTIVTIGNESLITRARNKIFSLFINYKEEGNPNFKPFDYLLFLDADITIDPRNILKLMFSGKDVIGASVRLKDLSRKVYNFGNILDREEDPIVKVDRVGTAVLLISKKAALKVVDYVSKEHPEWIYYHNSFFNRVDSSKVEERMPIYDVFQCGCNRFNENEMYLSEDYFFCYLLRKLGIDIYVDLSIVTGHNGNVPLV